MKKKALWILIIAVFGFIIYDYISTSNKEQAALEEAQQTSERVAPEENGQELTTEEDAVDLPEDMEDLSEEEFNEILEAYGNNHAGEGSAVQFGAEPGYTAYDFYLEDMNGNFASLSDYRGKKVFLNFWASWCPPCRVEMPHLQAFAEENDDVVVLGVNVTSSESDIANVEAFVEEFGLTFPNFYGNEELYYLYHVQSLPTSYFIDSNGVVNEAVIGPVTQDILEARFSMME
ncbi:MAG TPA: TlpA disulfide reductase family protein [Atopostipes sp.]|nr:TlpA disulfide reductase family protein [Atopostipes sp.]